MLLTILAVFLITEVSAINPLINLIVNLQLPQGLLSILSAVYTNDVHSVIYFMVGDLLDLLSLVNSSFSFVLVSMMSSRRVLTSFFLINE